MAKGKVIIPTSYRQTKTRKPFFKWEQPSPEDLSHALNYVLLVSVPFFLILLGLELYLWLSGDNPIFYDWSATTKESTTTYPPPREKAGIDEQVETNMPNEILAATHNALTNVTIPSNFSTV
ncbi:unnamed protein product [Ceutorhynchus assimilis]|uniref:Uncharacterized protein n=1 Tax=Ceutorhynchus assimilis TaxID=467358 RepID=A0A9N9QNV8_9CUCU|nr:unnamed protein product [Ceutorhynchus assimilis]